MTTLFSGVRSFVGGRLLNNQYGSFTPEIILQRRSRLQVRLPINSLKNGGDGYQPTN
jgi:hypothetical protein